MGNTTTSSRPRVEFEEPWRKANWGEAKNLKKRLSEFSVTQPNVENVRILLTGSVGSGKSSFINSVQNAFVGRVTSGALVSESSSKSFTKIYRAHHIEEKNGTPLPFVMNDVMGLEEEGGVRVEDINKALEGFLAEGYKFNPESALTDKDTGFQKNPSLGDRAFCVVNVMAADKVSMMGPEIIAKMRQIREKASELQLPQVIIMTRVDEACPLVKDDLQKIYTSMKIKEKMQECSMKLGIPMIHIFPVKNYHEEIDPDNNIDYLILKALEQIVNIANDALKKTKSSSSDSSVVQH